MRTVPALSLIAFLLLGAAPALAASTCLCVGNNSGSYCGRNAMGGAIGDKSTATDADVLLNYLMSSASKTKFTSMGKGFDVNTGWYCSKGGL